MPKITQPGSGGAQTLAQIVSRCGTARCLALPTPTPPWPLLFQTPVGVVPPFKSLPNVTFSGLLKKPLHLKKKKKRFLKTATNLGLCHFLSPFPIFFFLAVIAG